MKPRKPPEGIDVFQFTDYRDYLRTVYQTNKEKKRFFTLKYFADLAGFGSPGYLKMVMDGQRNLSPKAIGMVSRALDLPKKAAAYFETLVLYNQATADRDRELYLERLATLQPRPELTGLEKDKFEYFTKFHHVVIREMVVLGDFREDPDWIAARLSPPIKPREAAHSLALLQNLGLLRRNAAGKLVQQDPILTTPPESAAFHREIFAYHAQMLSLAKIAMMRVPYEYRDISALAVPIPLSLLPQIKALLQETREKILNLLNRDPHDFETVYHLNTQLFPVTALRASMVKNPSPNEAS